MARPGYKVDFVAELGNGRRRLHEARANQEEVVTHTYVTLEVSAAAFNEIKDKLTAAGYDHTFMDDGGIDLHGLALVNGEASSAPGASTPLTINEAAHGFEDTQEDYYGLGGRGVSSG